jgi:hypothetical protein
VVQNEGCRAGEWTDPILGMLGSCQGKSPLLEIGVFCREAA